MNEVLHRFITNKTLHKATENRQTDTACTRFLLHVQFATRTYNRIQSKRCIIHTRTSLITPKSNSVGTAWSLRRTVCPVLSNISALKCLLHKTLYFVGSQSLLSGVCRRTAILHWFFLNGLFGKLRILRQNMSQQNLTL